MTIGSQISDQRSYTFSQCSGSVLCGDYFEKHWSGTDRPNKFAPLEEHTYSLTVHSYSNPPILFQYDSDLPSDPMRPGTVFSCFGGTSYPDLSFGGNDELKLLGKLNKKIRDNDFNGDAFLAEGHQVLNLLSVTATRLATFMESIRHGNFYRAGRSLGKLSIGSKVASSLQRNLKLRNGVLMGNVADAILEVQYGWRPLLSDAYSFGEALAAIANKVPKQSYRVTRKIMADDVALSGFGRWKRRSTIFVKLKVVIESEPLTRQILHMNDPLAAAWEFTPWSFIADWFLPIGDYLQALNLMRELKPTVIVRSQIRKDSALFLDAPGYRVGNTSCFQKDVLFNRTLPTLSTVSDVPTPEFKKLSKVFSPEHTLNAFALLTSTANSFSRSVKF